MDPNSFMRSNTPISDSELKRRWTAIRGVMRREGIDVLVTSANNDYMGGYVKYLSDEPATMGYRVSLVFPLVGNITMVRHGSAGCNYSVPPNHEGLWRGPGQMVKTAAFETVYYTNDYEGAALTDALRPHAEAGTTIGLVGAGGIPAPMMDTLRTSFPTCEFVDASDSVDQVKMVKSDEELGLIRRTAVIQDAVMDEVFNMVKPGMRESDITAIARSLSESKGSEQGTYLSASTAIGMPAYLMGRHYQDRVLNKGDLFYLLLEANGPGGLYAQLGRTCILGKAPDWVLEEYGFTLEAQRYSAKILVPGAVCAEVWHEYNTFIAAHGRSNDERYRLHCHGQGYDIVERPLIRQDEPGTVPVNAHVASHPVHTVNGTVFWISENFIVGVEGVGESIHECSKELIEL